MISCTEFIPAYSELFTYIEYKDGRQAVDKFWKYLFKPDGKGIPLVNFVEREGIKGCFTYWSGTLSEEAADFTLYLNEKAGWFRIEMHRCPSKGRLLQLEKEIGITPYHDYCLHCDSYRDSVNKMGLVYEFDFSRVDKASCSILIYDPKIYNGNAEIDKDTVIMDRRASDNEYFHPDFHSSMNNGIHYVGENYGLGGVKEYLQRYANAVFAVDFLALKEKGLKAIEDKIVSIYAKEKALDAISTKNDGKKLSVTINYCPAVKHLKATGREVSKWYRHVDEFIMPVLAKEIGATFSFNRYDEETGCANYTFTL